MGEAVNATDNRLGPGLFDRDIREFDAARDRCLELMRDGQWHTRDEIVAVTGQVEWTRRLRDLRHFGHVIEKRRNGIVRVWEYRIKPETKNEQH